MTDEITEADVMAALDNAGLRYHNTGRYLVTQCPLHQDRDPSCQIFKDDWWCNCLAGCGRFHISKPFPQLKGGAPLPLQRSTAIEPQRSYQIFDFMDVWKSLPKLPASTTFKNIPVTTLNQMGWRVLSGEIPGMGSGYFIPYFNQSRTAIPFGQTRHLAGTRRFTFAPDAKPTLYGKWNIPKTADPGKLFLVEGASDAAVLDDTGIPWIAAPSASSGALVAAFAKAAKEKGIAIVYAGDNDDAGDSLKAVLDKSKVPYRVCQPPISYKDWGEFHSAQGFEGVWKHALPYLLE